MSLIGKISRKASERNLPFIIIGGHAVMAHGFVRTTSDWDLLICETQAAEWRAAMQSLGFELLFSGSTFLQFHPLPGEPAALDLMFVDESNFQQMLAAAESFEVEGVTIKVVSVPHLFALKCHAFKNNPHRAMKDIEDIVQLVRINKLDLNEPVLRSTLLKHGGTEFYELLKRECERPGIG
jgi:predicted nucleotidyltransferase